MPARGMSAAALKYAAIMAMLIDHIGWMCVPLNTPLAQVMHFLGRLTAPVMFYFIAEGYEKTRSLKNYYIRLGALALISHVPFVYFELGRVASQPSSVASTLFLGLLAIYVWDRINNISARLLAVAAISLLAINSDWSFFGVIMCLGFHLTRGNQRRAAAFVAAICFIKLSYIYLMWWTEVGFSAFIQTHFFHLGMLLAIPALGLYNGKLGSRASRYVFYVFYPAHLVVLGLIRWGFPA